MIELVTNKPTKLELQHLEPINPQSYYDKGYKDGAASVIDFARYANKISFATLNIFGTKEAVLELDNVTSLNAIFYIEGTSDNKTNTNTTVEHLTIICKKPVKDCYRLIYCDNYTIDNTLKHLTLDIDMSQTTNCNNMFNQLLALEIIDGKPIDFTNVPNNINTPFRRLEALKEVRFVPNSIQNNLSMSYSSVLSNETIESIIAGLADLTGKDTKTVTFTAKIGGKLTDAQREAIAAKNWTLTY